MRTEEEIRLASIKINNLFFKKQPKALRDHPWLLSTLKEKYGDLPNNELLYRGLNPEIEPTCNISGRTRPFIDKKIGYRQFCADAKSNLCQCYIESAAKKRTEFAKIQDKALRLQNFKNTMIEKYGVENPMQNPELIEKRDKTVMERYGVSNVFQSEGIKGSNHTQEANKKRKETYLIKYGVTHQSYKHLGIEIENLLRDKDKFLEEILKYNTVTECIQSIGINRSTFWDKVDEFDIRNQIKMYNSYPEDSLSNFFQSLNISFIQNDRQLIKPKELDFLFMEKKIAIELNGLHFHSEQFKDKNYHYNKFKECLNKGFQLIQIWDDEWINNQEVWKKRLKYVLGLETNVIGARKTNIKEISFQEAKQFLISNHIQGFPLNISYSYGAYFNGELVSVMCFNVSKEVVVLNRFASNCNVQGIFSKLLKFAIDQHNWNEIKSISDNRYSLGNLYQNNGWNYIKEYLPTYYYTDGYKIFHRFNFRKKSIKNRFGLDVTGKTEIQLIDQLGYDRIWDAGKKLWQYKREL